jgi:hypothetical protein
MHLVQIRREDGGLAEPMGRMRAWLDAHNIKPTLFDFDEQVFRLEFATAREAVDFAGAFDGWFGSNREKLAA